jgi:DNA-binding transcriptional LysR family regulator
VVETAALVRVFPEPVTHNTGWLVYHETSRDTARVRAAVDVLLEFFASEAGWFAGTQPAAAPTS